MKKKDELDCLSGVRVLFEKRRFHYNYPFIPEVERRAFHKRMKKSSGACKKALRNVNHPDFYYKSVDFLQRLGIK